MMGPWWPTPPFFLSFDLSYGFSHRNRLGLALGTVPVPLRDLRERGTEAEDVPGGVAHVAEDGVGVPARDLGVAPHAGAPVALAPLLPEPLLVQALSCWDTLDLRSISGFFI